MTPLVGNTGQRMHVLLEKYLFFTQILLTFHPLSQSVNLSRRLNASFFCVSFGKEGL